MIFLTDVQLAFGGRTLFDGLTWAVKPGQRVALVGPNGAGKTTLLRVVSGRMPVDGGSVNYEGGARVGYLAQDVQELDTARSPLEEALHAFDDVLALEAEERRLTAAMEAHPDHTAADYARLVEQFDRVHSQLLSREAHTIRPRTEAVLHGLGFEPDEVHRPLATFSGGWRMRVALAQILLRQPDVLLLDEPTNHLDIESIDWLEGYLKAYPGAVVLVSHDRYFLDRMTTRTAELANGRIEEYAGNYSFYLDTRQERRAIQQASYENQQKLIADTERFIERFRAKATKATQVQSRIKQLDKLERIAPPPSEPEQIRFRFPDAPPSGRTVVELSRFSKTYPTPEGGRTAVFDGAGPVAVERGAKVALVGKNGAGKSTLARMLLGTEPFEGERTLGYRVLPAYFAQHQADSLDPGQTVLESLREVGRGQSETELRSLLGAFLFHGDDVFKPVAVLSGGEKSRVALARTLLSPANFLVLDEPTNHLDMASKAVLAEALRQYSGAFVVVSHDRHFLDQIVNEVWYVDHGEVRAYTGTYSEAQWQRTHGTAARLLTPEAAAPAASARTAEARAPSGETRRRKTKEEKRAEAEARNAAYRAGQGGSTPGASTPAAAAAPQGGNGHATAAPKGMSPEKRRRALAALEREIEAHEATKTALEAALADPDLYQRPDEFQARMAEFTAVEQKLAELYPRWEALAEAESA